MPPLEVLQLGKALLYQHNHYEVKKEKIEPDKVDKEISILEMALENCVNNTEKLLDSLVDEEQIAIVETHLIMLQDPEYIDEIKRCNID